MNQSTTADIPSVCTEYQIRFTCLDADGDPVAAVEDVSSLVAAYIRRDEVRALQELDGLPVDAFIFYSVGGGVWQVAK